MRRGKLDTTSIVYIIIAGFFALLSFAMDQAAVQTEDRVRDANVKYQNYLFHFTSGKNFIMTLNNVTHIVGSRERNLSNKTSFLSNIIGYLFFVPSYVNNNFKNQDQYLNSLKTIYVGEFKDLYREQLHEFTKIINLIKALNLDEVKYGSYIKNLESLYNVDFNHHSKLIESIDITKGFDSPEELERYYGEIFSMNVMLKEGLKPINAIIDIMVKNRRKYGDGLGVINKNVVELKSYKNFFILFGILFQILGLMFLLLLFRTILKKI